jgi:transcriptional regulator GlxA family with amidase domain
MATEGKNVVFLTLPRFRELDLVGILDVFASANRILHEDQKYQIEILTSADEELVGMYGLNFAGTRHFKTFKGSIDTLLIPGGIGVETGTPPKAVLNWLSKKAQTTRRVGSICTGAFLLAQAGLLEGRRATTHWAFAEELATRFPGVKVEPDPIWIRDGNIYTSAGVSSGIDLGLAMIEEDHGNKVALEVARTLVVFLCRPGNQAQFSVSLKEQATEGRPLRDLQMWMLEHLQADLSIPALASRAAMSERNFQRVFSREIGKSPAHYVEEIRIEAVRRKLERSMQSLDEIASACGFGSADVMNRSFQRQLKVTPAEYRARFQSSGIDRPTKKKMPQKLA